MVYQWQRFWCARDGNYSLSPRGYLQDYGAAPYRRLASAVQSFDEIAATPVLVLLGEPGSGKTHALNTERQALEGALHGRGAEKILWPDLRGVGDAQSFYRAVVDTPEFQSWARGEVVLHLYLDALDECMLRVRPLGSVIIAELRKGFTDRLKLRLSCRTAEWSNELENQLGELFGEANVKVFELLPLREVDVAEAVRASGLDEEVFFRYVDSVGAAALAIRPVSLEFLLRCFRRNALPTTQEELFERGCLALCEESEHRSETGLRPTLSAVQRLSVAKRLAACSIFSNRLTILNGREDADTPSDALHLHELAGGEARAGLDAFAVGETGIRETLDTGLFTSRAAKVLGWSHRTYQEYLAARYIAESNLELSQILSLVVHPEDAGRKLAPHLHEVAAWLCALMPAVRAYVMNHEPEVLLRSTAVFAHDDDRRQLVDGLLRAAQAGALGRTDIFDLGKFEKLRHATLATQLRQTIRDRALPEAMRSLAVSIGKYAEVRDLLADFTSIALDPSELLDVRIDAASAVANSDDLECRALLRPLLDLPGAKREERWLWSLALKALWPHAIEPEEFFARLEDQIASSEGGYMLAESVSGALNAVPLAAPLKWVLKRVRAVPSGRSITFSDDGDRIADAILREAWVRDEGGTDESLLAAIALEKMRRYQPFLSRQTELNVQQWIEQDVERRRRFARRLLAEMAQMSEAPRSWQLFQETRFFLPEDVEWLVSEQVPELSSAEDRIVGQVLFNLADLTRPATLDVLFRAAQSNAYVAERLDSLCCAIDLGSEDAMSAREEYAETLVREEWRLEQITRREALESFGERQRQALARAESDARTFWHLADEMTLSPERPHYNRMMMRLSELPLWSDLDASTQRRILDVADRFLVVCDPSTDEWFGTSQFALAGVGAVRALLLLQSEAPTRFAAVSQEIWSKWIGSILSIPNNDPHVPLLRDAYLRAPAEVRRRIGQLVSCGDLYILQRLSDVIDEPLVRAIVDAAATSSLSDESLARVLSVLLSPPSPVARAFAESVFSDPTKAATGSVVAGAALLLNIPNDSWDLVWPRVSADRQFGRTVIECAVQEAHYDRTPMPSLTAPRLGELYAWLCEEYPPEEDPVREGIYSPDLRDHIVRWRSLCLQELKVRGSDEACLTLRALAERLPHQRYLRPLIVEAEGNRLAKTWTPVSVVFVRELLADRKRRLVRGEAELMDVVVESLGRLQQTFQSETPAARDLWNSYPTYRPKTENEISDYVARYLRTDLSGRGIILGREVEFRATSSPGSGERIDILLGAITDSGSEFLTIAGVVEMKGCWNRDVSSAMRDQLAERYLRGSSTRTGAYVVAWVHCAIWDEDDGRKRSCRVGIDGLRESLALQASDLAKEGFDVRAVVLDASLR